MGAIMTDDILEIFQTTNGKDICELIVRLVELDKIEEERKGEVNHGSNRRKTFNLCSSKKSY